MLWGIRRSFTNWKDLEVWHGLEKIEKMEKLTMK